jgi:hypothetical protein
MGVFAMRNLRSAFFLGVGSCLAIVACSSKSGQEDTGNGGSSGYNPNSGGAGSGLVAQDTADGTKPITSDQATAIGSSACKTGTSTPTGSGYPILEFVIDASGSMVDDPADPSNPNGPSKWDVFSQTLPNVFSSLPASFAVGVTYYHLNGGRYTGTQAVAIAPLADAQKTALGASVSRANPGGYTPTYCAWKFGFDTLGLWQAPADYASSPKYIVLITDGVPTVKSDCQTTQNPISQSEYDTEIGLITTQGKPGQPGGVKTFVISVVGSENPQNATYDPLYMLSKLAEVGGTAKAGCTSVSGTPAGDTLNPRGTYCHIDLSQSTNLSADLTGAIGNIATSVLSCTYSVPPSADGQPVDPDKTVLVFNDGSGNNMLILQNTSGTCDKGWHFTDATRTQIEICGVSCEKIQNAPNASLQLVFGCSVPQIVN